GQGFTMPAGPRQQRRLEVGEKRRRLEDDSPRAGEITDPAPDSGISFDRSGEPIDAFVTESAERQTQERRVLLRLPDQLGEEDSQQVPVRGGADQEAGSRPGIECVATVVLRAPHVATSGVGALYRLHSAELYGQP